MLQLCLFVLLKCKYEEFPVLNIFYMQSLSESFFEYIMQFNNFLLNISLHYSNTKFMCSLMGENHVLIYFCVPIP